MTPSEELRAAATRLRELAATATGGQWGAQPMDQESFPGRWFVDSTEDADDNSTSWDSVAEVDSLRAAQDACWIAAMSPAAAEPIALWLELAAGTYQRARLKVDCGVSLNVDSWVGDVDRSALRVARLILEAKT